MREAWKAEQEELREQLKEYDDFKWVLDLEDCTKTTLKRVAAIDISYSKVNEQKAVAALYIFTFPDMKQIYEDFEVEEAHYPYIPGFLAFKEIPAYEKLFDRLFAFANYEKVKPDVLLVDGNGVLHTRGFGCASHVGVVFDLPSIGVGKTVFAVDGIT